MRTFKTKVAFLFGYAGDRFQGMQFQRDTENTLENLLHSTLLSLDFILKTNATQLKRINWSRAARTDKKVHALCNGISLKLQIGPEFVEEGTNREINFPRIVAHINQSLPPDVRLFTMKKAAKHFDMRQKSQNRVYSYLVPARLFLPFQTFKAGKDFSAQELKQILIRLNLSCKRYLGCHKFHNFSKGMKWSDAQSQRFMIQMHAEQVPQETVKLALILEGKASQQQEPQIDQKKPISFLRFTLIGQSFIYHQIRKMIGLLIAIESGNLEQDETFQRAFDKERFDVLLAPAEGLYLNSITFDHYNASRVPSQRLEFNERQQKTVTQFQQLLEKKILQHQLVGNVFTNWLINRIEGVYEAGDNPPPESEAEQSHNVEQNAQ